MSKSRDWIGSKNWILVEMNHFEYFGKYFRTALFVKLINFQISNWINTNTRVDNFKVKLSRYHQSKIEKSCLKSAELSIW